MNESTLKKYQAVASIASYIAIPLIIAAIGFVLQSRLGDDGLSKDYVSIAVGILKDNPTEQEPELRKWAVAVLDKHSPIPFSNKTKESLESGMPIILPGLTLVPPPEDCMVAPQPRKIYSTFEEIKNKDFINQQEFIDELIAFVDLVSTEEYNANVTAINLECLQSWANIIIESDDDYRKSIGAPDSKSILEKLAKERDAAPDTTTQIN